MHTSKKPACTRHVISVPTAEREFFFSRAWKKRIPALFSLPYNSRTHMKGHETTYVAIPSSCCRLRKKNPKPACTYVCLCYVCSGGVVVHSKEYTHEMHNIFPKIFFSYAATCAGSSSFKLAAIATAAVLRAEGWKNQASMWFGKNALECMVAFAPHAGNSYSQFTIG